MLSSLPTALLLLATTAQCKNTLTPVGTPLSRPTGVAIPVSSSANGAGDVLPESFVSFSIEFYFFPDFAGNKSEPNEFSNNLLDNLGKLQGTKPYIRVGGNTQDYALYDASLDSATVGIYNLSISQDYPLKVSFGPSYFESYATWPDTKFIHGFNLAKNTSAAREALLASVPLACKALRGAKLAYWELGNEPDLFKTSAQGIVRPSWWNEQDYVDEWLNGTRAIRKGLAKACPEDVTDEKYQYYAPSFAGTSNSLDPIRTWHDGVDADDNIAFISSHNYIGGATQPGVTLRGTLMNHTSNVVSISHQLNESRLLQNYSLPFILGETNSLYNEGAPGLSNSFGAALWGVDFNLYCASKSIVRVHMHQGTSFRYQSWQPIDTDRAPKGTKPPYYGNIAVAAALGDLTAGDVQVKEIPLANETESAYSIYSDDKLKRIMIINLDQYNYTAGMEDSRPASDYWFKVPKSCAGIGRVQRLWANGSDAITGVTFGGYSYNYELDNGKPVRLTNVTSSESPYVGMDGMFQLSVPASSAALVDLTC